MEKKSHVEELPELHAKAMANEILAVLNWWMTEEEKIHQNNGVRQFKRRSDY